jgi:L-gulonolactone oxidase
MMAVRTGRGAATRSSLDLGGTRWNNWDGSQSCQPERIFRPRDLGELVEIVRLANRLGRRVRAAGTGHTMGPLSVTEDFLVQAANLTAIGPVDVDRRLVTIESGVRVGALDRFLRGYGLAVPSNVVLTSVQYGGVIATGCHGAGRECRPLSDLVEDMTIVTHSGEVVTYHESTHGRTVMNAVRCNLGTFGLIYRITLRVTRMFNLETVDQHLPLEFMADPACLREFVTRNDYTEIFWLPLASGVWAKSWNRTAEPAGRRSVLRPAADLVKIQTANMLWRGLGRAPRLTGAVNDLLYRLFTPRQRLVLDAPDAMHYQCHIEAVRCHIASFAIEIDPLFHNVRDAWWLVVEKVRRAAADRRYPLNLVLEMRVVANSRALLSPAFGAGHGHHCYFELISKRGNPGSHAFFDEVARAWMEMPWLHARPHWAKYFSDIPGIVPYIHRVWGQSLADFVRVRDSVDPDRMFLNPALERILYNDAETGTT